MARPARDDGGIVVGCAAFGLTVSEAKTEIIRLRTKGMPEAIAKFSVEAAGQVYNQSIRIPREKRQPQHRPVYRNRPA